MQATINAVKPIAGTKANAYLIFDYQSRTDFKFAGLNIANNRLEIGHRTATGWIVDTWTNARLKADTDYIVLLTADASTLTIKVGATTLSYTFAPRVDVLGVKHGLNDGLVGLGANNAKAQIDDVIVQSGPGPITLDKTVDFSAGATTLFQ